MDLTRYEALFQGAARLGLLLGARGLDWTRSAPYVQAFSEELSAYQELSLTPGGGDLGLMTRGGGKDFTHRVTRYLELRGVGEPRLRRLLVTADYFEHRNLFFKLELHPGGSEQLSWYLRRRPPLEVARGWLAAAGVGEEALARLDAAAAALGKDTAHFLGAAEDPGGAPTEKVYLSQPAGASWDGLLAAGDAAGLPRECWDPLLMFRPALEGLGCFLSLEFQGGRLLPGLKLDIAGAPANIGDALAGAGAEEGALLRELFDRPDYDYLGVRLRPGSPPVVKAYAYRQAR